MGLGHCHWGEDTDGTKTIGAKIQMEQRPQNEQDGQRRTSASFAQVYHPSHVTDHRIAEELPTTRKQ